MEGRRSSNEGRCWDALDGLRSRRPGLGDVGCWGALDGLRSRGPGLEGGGCWGAGRGGGRSADIVRSRCANGRCGSLRLVDAARMRSCSVGFPPPALRLPGLDESGLGTRVWLHPGPSCAALLCCWTGGACGGLCWRCGVLMDGVPWREGGVTLREGGVLLRAGGVWLVLRGGGMTWLEFLGEFLPSELRERDMMPWRREGSSDEADLEGVAGAATHTCSPRSVRETEALQFEHFTVGRTWDILPALGGTGDFKVAIRRRVGSARRVGSRGEYVRPALSRGSRKRAKHD